MAGWIGVDLDGTLAQYNGWVDVSHIGPPIPLMVNRVKEWIKDGQDVRIFTARVSDPEVAPIARLAIESWCLVHLDKVLPVTHEKDLKMYVLYDDRAVRVERNTGVIYYDHFEESRK